MKLSEELKNHYWGHVRQVGSWNETVVTEIGPYQSQGINQEDSHHQLLTAAYIAPRWSAIKPNPSEDEWHPHMDV